MRKSFVGLSALVRRHLAREPSDGQRYAFINQRRTQIKVPVFKSGGYCVWGKRLEQGQFGRTQQADAVMTTTPQAGCGGMPSSTRLAPALRKSAAC